MRNFLKQTLASTLGSLVGLSLFSVLSLGVLLVTIGVIVETASNKDPQIEVADKSILVLDLSRSIVDLDPGETLQETLTGQADKTIELKSVIDAIDGAAKDKRIVAIYLDGSKGQLTGGTGLASLQEVRKALERFRATGKQIIAYDVDLDKRSYYLASVANQIFINPMGSIDINGFRSEMMFFKGAFDKYGIGVEVVRVGKYKSFGETWSLNKFSPAAKQETQDLLNDLWADFKNNVADSRKITPEKIQSLADSRGLLTAPEAIANKLVDRVLYPDEAIAELKKISGKEKDKSETFAKVKIEDYADLVRDHPHNSDHQIAVVYAQGSIVNGAGIAGQIGGDSFAKQLRDLRLDDRVKAVVLRVNSPGGSAVASDIIQREVRLIKKVKPVVVSMGDVAASGGYWISTYANKIFAEPTTITGSIGVIGINFNYQKLANNNGITWDVVKTSKLADSNTISRPRTPQELAISQKMVNDIYDDFISKVAESRNLPKAKVSEIAQGRVWSGIDAKGVGLVDELGGLNDAIEYAAKLAKLGKDWELEEYPEVESWEEKLLKKVVGDRETQIYRPQDVLTQELLKVKSELNILQTLNDPRGVYARLPFNLHLK
jgi:protease-4